MDQLSYRDKGGSYRVMMFDHVVSASNGDQVAFLRVAVLPGEGQPARSTSVSIRLPRPAFEEALVYSDDSRDYRVLRVDRTELDPTGQTAHLTLAVDEQDEATAKTTVKLGGVA